jgi:hypothetical protein
LFYSKKKAKRAEPKGGAGPSGPAVKVSAEEEAMDDEEEEGEGEGSEDPEHTPKI